MYDELIKRLREEASSWCINCCYRAGDYICGAPDDRKKDCDICSKLEAANAIEELSKLIDESIPKSDAEIIIEELNKPRWIPVTERLPEAGERVLCYCRANIYEVMKMRTDGDWVYDVHHIYMHSFVTHWMPLPEPPKEV